MASAYLILAIIFAFELLAWTLLFNFVLHGGKFGAGWRTLPALLLGSMWGLGIFAIDKGVIMADMSRPGFGKWAGFVGRFVVVGASAVLTAQPIHQLFFHSQVEDRLKDETIRAEAVALNPRYQREEAQVVKVSGTSPQTNNALAERQKAEANRADADSQLGRAERALQQREADHRAAQQERASRQAVLERERSRGSDELVIQAAQSRLRAQDEFVQRALALVSSARDERDTAAGKAQAASAALDRADKFYRDEEARLRAGMTEDLNNAKHGRDDYTKLMDRLRNAQFGDKVEDLAGAPVRWANDGFIEREQVLWHLYQGQPARWPENVSLETRAAVATWAGLPGPSASVFAADTSSFRVPFIGLLLVAGAIPLLSMVYKLTMSEELKAYYSLEAQARSGNREAVQQLKSRGLYLAGARTSDFDELDADSEDPRFGSR